LLGDRPPEGISGHRIPRDRDWDLAFQARRRRKLPWRRSFRIWPDTNLRSSSYLFASTRQPLRHIARRSGRKLDQSRRLSSTREAICRMKSSLPWPRSQGSTSKS
jgi:hypothetical protein